MSNRQLPAPLSTADCDLRGYEYMPLFYDRLRGSEFYQLTRRNRAAFVAALNLWWAAWRQVPAGSLPQNDFALCNFADLGSDMRAWSRVRDVAMHGFILCSDGRYYHPVVCELAAEAAEKRRKARDRKARQRGLASDRPQAAPKEDAAAQPTCSQHAAAVQPPCSQAANGGDFQILELPQLSSVCPAGRVGDVTLQGKGREGKEESASLREAAAGAAGQGALFQRSAEVSGQGEPGGVVHFADEAARVRSQLWGEGKSIMGRVAPAMDPKRVGSLIGQLAKKLGGGIRGGTRAIQTLRDVEALIADGRVAGYAAAPTAEAAAAVLETYVLGMMHRDGKAVAPSTPSSPPKPGTTEWRLQREAERRARMAGGDAQPFGPARGPIIDLPAEAVR